MEISTKTTTEYTLILDDEDMSALVEICTVAERQFALTPDGASFNVMSIIESIKGRSRF